MEPTTTNQQVETNKAYNYAASLLIHGNKSEEEVIESLKKEGLDHTSATHIVSDLQQQIDNAKKERAKKDMLYGALWCVGGTVATIANIGFIFWGAIIFGGIQFFRGLMNFNK